MMLLDPELEQSTFRGQRRLKLATPCTRYHLRLNQRHDRPGPAARVVHLLLGLRITAGFGRRGLARLELRRGTDLQLNESEPHAFCLAVPQPQVQDWPEITSEILARRAGILRRHGNTGGDEIALREMLDRDIGDLDPELRCLPLVQVGRNAITKDIKLTSFVARAADLLVPAPQAFRKALLRRLLERHPLFGTALRLLLHHDPKCTCTHPFARANR